MKRFFKPLTNNSEILISQQDRFPVLQYKKISQFILTTDSKWNLQNLGFIFIIIISSFFVANGIVKGNMRLLVIVSLLFILGVSCLRIETGTLAILLYLPFMGIIRRYIYSFNAYVSFDPILIISSIMTLFMFGYIFIFYGEEIMKKTKDNMLLRYVTFLLILFLLEAMNPFQGGLGMGFSGVMYIVVPLLWFYFGFFIPTQRMESIFYMIIIVGVITALYGLRQIYYGLLPFEEYWVKYGGYTAIKVEGFIKAFSTFMSHKSSLGMF